MNARINSGLKRYSNILTPGTPGMLEWEGSTSPALDGRRQMGCVKVSSPLGMVTESAFVESRQISESFIRSEGR